MLDFKNLPRDIPRAVINPDPCAGASAVAVERIGLVAEQVALSQAARLARAGRYDEAHAVLEDIGVESPEALDLMARIRAQQGRLSDAEKLWSKALELSPGNASYLAAVDRAARIKGRGDFFPTLWFWCSLIGLLGAMTVAASVFTGN